MPQPRKSRALKVLEGRRGHKPLKDEPIFAPLLDDPPENLGTAGHELWERLIAAYDAAPVIQVTDYPALVALCRSWQLYTDAMADIAARGHVVASVRNEGDLVKNPSCVIASQALGHFEKLASQFGLTPASRAALDAPLPAETGYDPMREIFKVTAPHWKG